jgi:predicted ATPase
MTHRFVPGFGDEILEALRSDELDIRYQAVCAAGTWALDDARPQLVALATDDECILVDGEYLVRSSPRRSRGKC